MFGKKPKEVASAPTSLTDFERGYLSGFDSGFMKGFDLGASDFQRKKVESEAIKRTIEGLK